MLKPLATISCLSLVSRTLAFMQPTLLAAILLAVTLNGCAHAAKDASPAEERAATAQPPMRVIVYFSRTPAADSKQLAAVISEACRCHPVFFRQYSDNALIYELGLPQNNTFAAFEKAMLSGGVSLGIRAVEQDLLMQPQR